jgi:hypothetical protein
VRAAAAAFVALLALLPSAGRADAPWGSLEIGAGPYAPSIDSEFQGATPYQDVFGGAPGPMFRLHMGRAVWSRSGTLEIGVRTGFFAKSGHALDQNTGAPSPDKTSFYIVPTSLTLTYRADQLLERTGVPLVGYARVTLERYNWWSTKNGDWKQSGATNGYSGTLGAAFVLDVFDQDAARALENDVGIRHTNLYFDVTWDKVNDFGSDKSWDLSAKKLFWSAGLMFVY